MPGPNAPHDYVKTLHREVETTMRVLRAFPADQAAFKPTERSNSAHALAATFVVEQQLALRAVRDGQVLGGGFPAMPESWDAAVAQFERDANELAAAVERADEARLDGTVQFYGGPKQLADYPVMDFLWFMLHDQIHHRGQLSVYLRLVGAKVPSIYGPTADEPWN